MFLSVKLCRSSGTAIKNPYQLSDQRNAEGSAALPPQLQCMKRVFPDGQTGRQTGRFTFWRAGRDEF